MVTHILCKANALHNVIFINVCHIKIIYMFVGMSFSAIRIVLPKKLKGEGKTHILGSLWAPGFRPWCILYEQIHGDICEKPKA